MHLGYFLFIYKEAKKDSEMYGLLLLNMSEFIINKVIYHPETSNCFY